MSFEHLLLVCFLLRAEEKFIRVCIDMQEAVICIPVIIVSLLLYHHHLWQVLFKGFNCFRLDLWFLVHTIDVPEILDGTFSHSEYYFIAQMELIAGVSLPPLVSSVLA